MGNWGILGASSLWEPELLFFVTFPESSKVCSLLGETLSEGKGARGLSDVQEGVSGPDSEAGQRERIFIRSLSLASRFFQALDFRARQKSHSREIRDSPK